MSAKTVEKNFGEIDLAASKLICAKFTQSVGTNFCAISLIIFETAKCVSVVPENPDSSEISGSKSAAQIPRDGCFSKFSFAAGNIDYVRL